MNGKILLKIMTSLGYQLLWSLFLGLGFCIATNNLYFEHGKVVDYSIYAWIGMLLIWSVALYRYLHKKYDLIYMAVQLVIIVWAFDCWRLFIYGGVTDMKFYAYCFVSLDVFLMGVSAVIYNLRLFISALYGGILAFFGGYIAFPYFMPMEKMFLICGIVLIVIESFRLFKHYRLYKEACIILGVLGLVVGSWFYTLTDGIHFYEKKVTEMPKDIKVSVIVPVYNAEKTLERCLDSIRKQTLKEIEIICVNDGSTDDSREILEKYAKHDKRFVVINQKNAYVEAARNRGLDVARGKYIGFVDNDDRVSADYFEDMFLQAEKYQADVVVAQNLIKEYSLRSIKSKSSVRHSPLNKMEILANLTEQIRLLRVYIWDKIYKTSFLNEHYIRNTYGRYFYGDNYFFAQVMVNEPKVAVAHQATYYYNQKTNSVTARQDYEYSDFLAPTLYLELDNMLETHSSKTKQTVRTYILQKRQQMIDEFMDVFSSINRKKMLDAYETAFPNERHLWLKERN